MYKTDEVIEKIKEWSRTRGIIENSTDMSQCLKAVSEMGELADNINKGRDCRDDIGDIIVCLINIAEIRGYALNTCLNIAYDDIKDRKGYMNKNGVFIKESDVDPKEIKSKDPLIVNIDAVASSKHIEKNS